MSTKQEVTTADDFLFGGQVENDVNSSMFDRKVSGKDGIYRPKAKDAKNKTIGYKALIRFVPNYDKDGNRGPNALEKDTHFGKNLPDGLNGHYDCMKNSKSSCELCTIYWKLYNSNDVAEKERRNNIKASKKFYSYVMIIEDEQHPELVGKILLFPYTKTIADKISDEKTGKITGEPCEVFHPVNGKDFRLIINEKGGITGYDESRFLDSKSPIKLWSEKTNTMKTVPVDENGMISNKDVQAKWRELLTNKVADINEYKHVDWDAETARKASQIVSVLNGDVSYSASQSAKTGGANTAGGNAPTASNKTTTFDDKPAAGAGIDDFFDTF